MTQPTSRPPRPPSPPGTPRRRRLLAPTLLALGAGLLGGCQAALFSGLNLTTGPAPVSIRQGIVFDQRHALALDVYRPREARHAPVVVFFYGGSWKSGKRQWYRWAGEALAQRGLVVVIPDYRQWPQVRLDGFMSDAARAVAWAHAHAAEFGGDPAQLFLIGHSAGAHIAALLATNGGWLAAEGMQPRQLAGVIGLAGPYDFLPLTDPDFIDMFGSTHAEQLRSQPVHFVSGDEPPMLLLQGMADKVVQPRNASLLANALRAEHEPAQLTFYPGLGHTAILLALSRPFRTKAPVLDDTLEFIRARVAQRRHAKATAEP